MANRDDLNRAIKQALSTFERGVDSKRAVARIFFCLMDEPPATFTPPAIPSPDFDFAPEAFDKLKDALLNGLGVPMEPKLQPGHMLLGWLASTAAFKQARKEDEAEEHREMHDVDDDELANARTLMHEMTEAQRTDYIRDLLKKGNWQLVDALACLDCACRIGEVGQQPEEIQEIVWDVIYNAPLGLLLHEFDDLKHLAFWLEDGDEDLTPGALASKLSQPELDALNPLEDGGGHFGLEVANEQA